MGSPDFAVPTLQALSDHYPILGVITQPDRPAGRGRKLTPPPIKTLALDLGLPVIQPHRLSKDVDAMTQLHTWNPDLIVVVAFGQILKPDVLDLPPHGCLNVHASLLPRWRGVSPIQAAILNGDPEIGITVMRMDAGIDTGDIIHQCAIPIESDDTGGVLSYKLAFLGGKCLLEALPGYLDGTIEPKPQGESPTPYAPMLKKKGGELDFSQPAALLARKVRAYNPWPGTYTTWKGAPLKIHQARPVLTTHPRIGVFTTYQGLPAIGCQDGLLVLDQLQPAGKKSIPGDVFLRGARDWEDSARDI